MARIEFKPNPAAAANGIKFPGGGNVSASFQTLQDPGNNNLPISVSDGAVNFGTGVITSGGVLTVKGAGSNIFSLRNSANAQVVNVYSSGFLTCTTSIQANATVFGLALGPGLGNTFIYADAANQIRFGQAALSRMNFGPAVVGNPALYPNGAGLDLKTGTGSALSAFAASQFTSDNLSAGTLTTARPFKVGDRGNITEAGFVALGLNRQIAIEHNGTVYYVPVSTALIP